jgi:septum formation protein
MARTEAGLVLASGSPRRRELLSLICSKFEVLPADADERRMDGESPEALAGRLALLKARTAASQRPDAVVIGCDTVVALGDEVLGKPGTRDKALAHLMKLNGRTHCVFTGLAVIARGKEFCRVVGTEVEFGDFPQRVLEAYASTDEGLDKAGGYAIQGRGAFLVRAIRGSYTSVVGLPLYEAAEALRACGVEVFWE